MIAAQMATFVCREEDTARRRSAAKTLTVETSRVAQFSVIMAGTLASSVLAHLSLGHLAAVFCIGSMGFIGAMGSVGFSGSMIHPLAFGSAPSRLTSERFQAGPKSPVHPQEHNEDGETTVHLHSAEDHVIHGPDHCRIPELASEQR